MRYNYPNVRNIHPLLPTIMVARLLERIHSVTWLMIAITMSTLTLVTGNVGTCCMTNSISGHHPHNNGKYFYQISIIFLLLSWHANSTIPLHIFRFVVHQIHIHRLYFDFVYKILIY